MVFEILSKFCLSPLWQRSALVHHNDDNGQVANVIVTHLVLISLGFAFPQELRNYGFSIHVYRKDANWATAPCQVSPWWPPLQCVTTSRPCHPTEANPSTPMNLHGKHSATLLCIVISIGPVTIISSTRSVTFFCLPAPWSEASTGCRLTCRLIAAALAIIG